MLSFIVFLLGVGLGFWLHRSRARATKPAAELQRPAAAIAAPEPASVPTDAPVAPAVAPAVAEPQDFAGRLQVVRLAIETFGESASHPRQLRDCADFQRAVTLLSEPSVATAALIDYACGANWATSCAALAALIQRADGPSAASSLLSRFNETGGWEVYFSLEYVAKLAIRPAVGVILVRPPKHWSSNTMVRAFFAEHFTQREAMGDIATFGGALSGLIAGDIDKIEEFLALIVHPFARALSAELRQWRSNTLNRDFLATIGTFWTAEEDDLLIEHPAIAESVLMCESALTGTQARSVLLVGEARTGKTSVARCAARRLAASGYSVFEAGAAELMAGQSYIGELEGRIRKLVDELSVSKRVVWFVPSLLKLATSGTHKGQSASILDQVLPSIVAGRLVLISECSPSGLTLLQQRWPVLRTCVETLRLRSLTRPEVEALAVEFAQRLGRKQTLTVEPRVVPLAGELAGQYLSSLQLPGAVLDLLKLASNWSVANGQETLSRDALLGALSQATGLPRAILDNDERIELAAIRRFFDQRVIGQFEAVSAVVERIAMLKAGLTDPSRPVAVFLFAGPTGTGKTELAKTLAEYLFGNADRMVRLDMSEFQAYDSTRKIIGSTDVETESESLIQKIRKQPFSVVLLDEFEKAHQNVWDLFLQVFDDGRLTDAAGQTVDFRQTFIVMTSNIGATSHESSGVGFMPRNDQFANQQVMRAVAQSFRPEFVNRLDKVIVFQPLNREHMRAILQKELKRVLERRGIKNREWAVEWESSALDFLLERGFNAQMGARPLKRAIEQYVVAPLASNIVEHRFPSGEQFLFVRGTGDGIEVEFVDPDATESSERPVAPDTDGRAGYVSEPGMLARIALNPTGSVAEHEELNTAFRAIQDRLVAPPWQELRDSLLQRMGAADFWSQPDRARVHTHFALVDRVEAAVRTAASLKERYDRGLTKLPSRFSKDLANRFALQLFLVDCGVADVLAGPPQEVVLAVEPVFEAAADHVSVSQWSAEIAHMYRAWAKARRMQLQQMTGIKNGSMLFVIHGFGAASCLSLEAGLHVLDSDSTPGAGGAAGGRAAVRVSVGMRYLSDANEEHDAASLNKLLAAGVRNAVVVRRYRFGSSPLVRDAVANWRSGRIGDVMAGDFDLFSQWRGGEL